MKEIFIIIGVLILAVSCNDQESSSNDRTDSRLNSLIKKDLPAKKQFFAKASGSVKLLSHNRPARQSSVRTGQVSRRAFDGNKRADNNMQTERTRQPFLEVDLQGDYQLSYINIYNRNTTPISYAERLKNYYIFVSSSPFRTNDVNQLKSDKNVHAFFQSNQAGFPSRINIGKKGRYVRVQLAGTDYLHITELEVYGSSSSGTTVVDKPKDQPPTTNPPSSGKSQLLSRNKPTRQSSIRANQSGRLAVDGIKSSNNHMQTEFGYQPWFEIDLQKSYDLSYLNIFNRNTVPDGYTGRLKDYYIFVSDKYFRSNDINTLKKSKDVKHFYQTQLAGFPSKISLNTRGRYVRIQLSTNNYLHMTEVEVYGSGKGIVVSDNDSPPKTDPKKPENPQQPNPQPPINLNRALPMGGAFYGNYNAGILTGNSRIGYELSRRFRAQKSGDINAIRYNNRVLSDANIHGRCLPKDPNSVWCKCKNAGLDRYTCGYTLGNSYSVGNGGKIVIEIREDDGSSRHLPKSTVLAQAARPFVPMDHYNEAYPIIPLKNTARLQAGKIYHIVYRNLSPPTKCGLGGRSVAQAKSCPKNQGAIGLNGVFFGNMPSGKIGFDPFRGKSNAVLYKDKINGGWKTDPDNLSWYEVRYRDGVWFGDSYAAYNSIFHGAEKLVAGNSIVRQKFTVKRATRTVDGLWLNFGHKAKSSPDFSSLAVKVKDSSGRVIATGSIGASRYCAGKIKGSGYASLHCREWGYTNLNKTVSLLQNRTYTVEFSGSSRGQFVLSSFFPLNYGGYKSQDSNHWGSAQAEISTNGGRSWGGIVGSYYAERDLGMLFTIKGQPKALP